MKIHLVAIAAVVIAAAGATALRRSTTAEAAFRQQGKVSRSSVSPVSEDCQQLKLALDCLGTTNKQPLLDAFGVPPSVGSGSYVGLLSWGWYLDKPHTRLHQADTLVIEINEATQKVIWLEMKDVDKVESVLYHVFNNALECEVYYPTEAVRYATATDNRDCNLTAAGQTQEGYLVQLWIKANGSPWYGESGVDLATSQRTLTYKQRSTFNWLDGSVTKIRVIHPDHPLPEFAQVKPKPGLARLSDYPTFQF